MRKRIAAMTAMLLWVFCLLAGAGKSVAHAEEGPAADVFSGNVRMLKQEADRYVMQVTVENKGADFSGTVQLIFASSNQENCAYQTELTLPAQGKKQFTVTVTERAVNVAQGLCSLSFWDEKGELLQTIPLKNVFGVSAGITVGILSDHYSELTWLDAGGMNMSLRNINAPLALIELNGENLETCLSGLSFLVIDQYHVASLGEDAVCAIQDWVKGGGWLLIGTGACAEQTLSGFDEDFLGVELRGICKPGDSNFVSVNAEQYGFYYNYTGYVDFDRMTIADLSYSVLQGDLYESSENPALVGGVEDGAVSIFLFSFGEDELRKLDDAAVVNLFYETAYRSVSFRNYGGYSNITYSGPRAFGYIDSANTNLDFTLLEVLIIVYVVLVGPVLYLILRKCRRSEWYWVCAPVLGLVFIVGVYFIGRSAGVNETKVYSVTVQPVDGNRKDTYFLAYHAGLKPWDVLLDESYDVAGPGLAGYYGWYNGYNGAAADDYFYSVRNDSRGLSIGIKPRENFENGFLYAGGRAESRGDIFGANIDVQFSRLYGTVKNDTVCDMAYLAVLYQSELMIFSDVRAGETLDLDQAYADGRCVFQYTVSQSDMLLYEMFRQRNNAEYRWDDMSAMFIGLNIADSANPKKDTNAVVVGVVRDYDKSVAERCSEISYGCFYSFVQAGK